MIVGSLVLILTAGGLLAGGLILGNDWLLGASIVASLFAAALLYAGARQSASARRQEQAEIEDDEDWDDDESDQAGRRPWAAAEADPAPPVEPTEYGSQAAYGRRRSYDPPEYAPHANRDAPLSDGDVPPRDPPLDETTALDLTGREGSHAAPEPGDPEHTTRIPAQLYMNTRAGFARYPSNAQVPLSRSEEQAPDEPPAEAPVESPRHDSGALPDLSSVRSFAERPVEPVKVAEAAPEEPTEQWRAAPQTEPAFGAEAPAEAPPFGAPPVAAQTAAAAPEQDEWVGGGVDEEDPKDEPPIQRRPAQVAAAVARLGTDVFVIDGRPRYHVAGCVHLLGRESEPLPVGEAVDLGFTPCGLCEPDTALTSDAADNARR